MSEKILVVDDDPSFRRVVEFTLQEDGYETVLAANGEEALEKFSAADFSLVVTDVLMPQLGGLDFLRRAQAMAPETPVIVVTAHAAIEDAVAAMREGAFDYILKPIHREELKLIARKALEVRELRHENRRLRQVVGERLRFENMVGGDKAMRRVLEVAAQAARVDSTVLLLGESGTGKELLAKAIHFNSPRRTRPLVVVNCGAIPETLLEPELFGHTRGSFTGAVADRKGKIEAAQGGTVLLDEVGDLQPQVQVKLLRLLQEKEIDKVGVSQPLKVDVRIVAATHRDLPSKVKDGSFREDLYYRLSVIPILLPALRERREDIPLLAELFLKRYAERFGKKVKLERGVFRVLTSYSWPGNIRELENLMERLAALHDEEVITVEHLPEYILQQPPPEKILVNIPPGGIDLEIVEKELIRGALERNQWNQSRAARFLRITRNTLIYRMQKHGLASSPENATRGMRRVER